MEHFLVTFAVLILESELFFFLLQTNEFALPLHTLVFQNELFYFLALSFFVCFPAFK